MGSFLGRGLGFALTFSAVICGIALVGKGMTIEEVVAWYLPFGLIFCLVGGFLGAIFIR